MIRQINCGELKKLLAMGRVEELVSNLKITPGCKLVVVQGNCSLCGSKSCNPCSISSITVSAAAII